MADRVYSDEERLLIKKMGLEEFLLSIGKLSKKISEKDARASALGQYDAEVFKTGQSIFGKIPIGTAYDGTAADPEREMTEVDAFADLDNALEAKFIAKGVEADLALSIFTADAVTWIKVHPRDIAERSMKKQGLRINAKDITKVRGVRDARTRFNNVNDNNRLNYASGSYLSASVGGKSGPRFQGPAGGPNSANFIILGR